MLVNTLFLFFFFYTNISCEDKSKSSDTMKDRFPKDNFDTLSVAYELTYDNSSVVKAIIRTVNDMDTEIKFNARLKSEFGKKEYKLRCHNISLIYIECYSEKVEFNLSENYYFYYKKGEDGIYTIDEQDSFEDYKKVNLIFKPEMYDELVMYRDNRKILGLNNRKVVGGGYLYLVPQSKKLLHKPMDNFNKYIDLNNFISHAGLLNQNVASTLTAYKEVIKRGFHIVEADIQFTKDKIPVICHEKDLEKISDGNGDIQSKSLDELQKIDFGSKYDKKFEGEKILTFNSLLELCRENDVIVDLNFVYLDYKKYFEESDEYMKIILDIIEKNNMFNSIYFNDGNNPNTILKLQKLKNDISVCVTVNSKDNKEQLKEKYKNFKRVIYNIGDLSKDNNAKGTVKYFTSLGNRIKSEIVDDMKFAENLQSWGVNYISTNKIHPFFIQNEKEDPILLKCTQFDVLADCRLGPEVKLIDNEVYKIYYSKNIYKKSEDLVDDPIGEFKYLDTIELDDIYYTIKKFDFEKGILKLKMTAEIDKGKIMKGKIGPDGYRDHAADIYQYDFTCLGKDKKDVECQIFNEDKEIIRLNTSYSIYSIVNYSLYVKSNFKENTLMNAIEKKEQRKLIYIIILTVILIAFVSMIIYAQNDRTEARFRKVKTVENQ